jgi:hypothetical protein
VPQAYWRATWEAKFINDKGITNMEAAEECITRASESSWWKWLDGEIPTDNQGWLEAVV